jgi:uncharacterized protein
MKDCGQCLNALIVQVFWQAWSFYKGQTFMRVYRPILVVLTLLVTVLIGTTLIGSWTEPQAQSQLNLYQSDLLLNATEWESLSQEIKNSPTLRKSFLGENPVKDALKNYETVRKSAKTDLDKLKQQALSSPSGSKANPKTNAIDVDPGAQPVPRSLRRAKGQFVDDLDVRLGLLYTQTGQRNKALETWSQTIQNPQALEPGQSQQSAQVLRGLWSEPPEIFPNAEAVLNQNLTGWFKFESLSKLYQIQQRQDALSELNVAEQESAQNAFSRLLVVGIMPVLGSFTGVAILVIWGLRTFFSQRSNASESLLSKAKSEKQSGLQADDPVDSEGSALNAIATPQFPDQTDSAIAPATAMQRSVLWPQETILQVMVLWFLAFFGTGFLVSLGVSLLKLKPEMMEGGLQAYLALFNYACLMAAGFTILQLSLKRYVPNVLRWFNFRLRGNWIGWGLGGYFVALPMVLIVSLLNQQLLHEQGGGNPILEIILKSNNGLTIGLLWFLVAVCAPVFEETLFRGFFLTSLTRYLPIWQAIGLSGIVFAIAHLNLGDLLPLSLLGMVLGFVYLRSRNLLASILLHSLWNSGSFVSLLILGGVL